MAVVSVLIVAADAQPGWLALPAGRYRARISGHGYDTDRQRFVLDLWPRDYSQETEAIRVWGGFSRAFGCVK